MSANMTTLGHKEHKPVIVWQGDKLDGKLTITYCELCNEIEPSVYPETVVVCYALVASDGTEFVGEAIVSTCAEGIDKLLGVITEAYSNFIMASRKEHACLLH